MGSLILLSLVIGLVSCDVEYSPRVDYEQGVIEGRFGTDRNNHQFYIFQGIPYAQPPVGDLRFKPPVPYVKWNGTLKADKEGPKCPQRLLYATTVTGSEDCLYLNVYTPQLSGSRLLPVIVWFHGGSYVEGSGNTDIHGPENLMTKDVVLVTFNYRLGILGYLALDDLSLNITGNAASKDQLMVLDWVQKYIHHFGGDATKVTLGGNSAGASSIELLMLSNKAKFKFHRAMIQSGTITAAWAMGSRFDKQLSQVLDFKKNLTDVQFYEQLKQVPVENLINAQIQISGEQNLLMKIGPIVEDPNSYYPVITKEPSEIIQSGEYTKVPYLIGFTDTEAMFQILYIQQSPNYLPVTVADFERFLPSDMNLTAGSETSKKIAEKVKTFYYKEETPTMKNLDIFFKMTSDIGFVSPISRQVRMLSQHLAYDTPMFFYLFSLDTDLNLFKRQTNLTKVFPGAAHTDEKGYLFNYTGAPIVIPGSQLDTYVKQMLTLWSNFATFGDPNGVGSNDPLISVKWDKVEKDRLNFLNIAPTFTKGVDPFKDRVAFWDELYAEAKKGSGNIPGLSLVVLSIMVLIQLVK